MEYRIALKESEGSLARFIYDRVSRTFEDANMSPEGLIAIDNDIITFSDKIRLYVERVLEMARVKADITDNDVAQRALFN